MLRRDPFFLSKDQFIAMAPVISDQPTHPNMWVASIPCCQSARSNQQGRWPSGRSRLL